MFAVALPKGTYGKVRDRKARHIFRRREGVDAEFKSKNVLYIEGAFLMAMLFLLASPKVCFCSAFTAKGFISSPFAVTSAWGTTSDKVYSPASLNPVDDVHRELAKSPRGEIIFNPQTRMKVLEWHTVEILISPEVISSLLLSKLSQKLRRHTYIQYTSLAFVTRKMKVLLVPDKPDEFEVKPAELVFYITGNEVKQEVSVKPLKTGDLTLHLKVFALITDPKTRLVEEWPYEELSRPIKVEASASLICAYIKHAEAHWALGCAVLSGMLLTVKKVRLLCLRLCRKVKRA